MNEKDKRMIDELIERHKEGDYSEAEPVLRGMFMDLLALSQRLMPRMPVLEAKRLGEEYGERHRLALWMAFYVGEECGYADNNDEIMRKSNIYIKIIVNYGVEGFKDMKSGIKDYVNRAYDYGRKYAEKQMSDIE